MYMRERQLRVLSIRAYEARSRMMWAHRAPLTSSGGEPELHTSNEETQFARDNPNGAAPRGQGSRLGVAPAGEGLAFARYCFTSKLYCGSRLSF